MKKAYELTTLCDCQMAMLIFSSSNELYAYFSSDLDHLLLEYTQHDDAPKQLLTNKDIMKVKYTLIDGKCYSFIFFTS